MKRMFLWVTCFILLFCFAGNGWAQEEQVNPIMKPDPATREKWYREYINAPEAYIDSGIAQTLDWGPRPLLLDKLTYTPSERNQVACGNCWVWAGTGVLEILHSVEHGANDRLSIQYFDSCFDSSFSYLDGNEVTQYGYYACGGGNLSKLAAFYNARALRSWSNTNAQFQDAAGGSAPHVACADVGSTPRYSGTAGHFIATTVTTTGVTQATAISNIKNILNQHKGVQFNFWLGSDTDWDAFRTFWRYDAETDIWNPDTGLCSVWYDPDEGGGHAVLIVGYNDDDADTANHYWIVLNSWGTGLSNNRPNGLFRMKMYMNYGCTLYDNPSDASGSSWYSRQFVTLNTQDDPFYDYNSLYMAAKGSATNNIWFRKKNSGGSWGSWTLLDGATSHTPAMANFNSRLYMAVKGVVTPKIWVRSMNYQDTWTSWAEVPGGSTSAAPTLVTYRNRLYVFARGSSTSKIWYNSMGASGVWSGWLEVPGAATIDSPAVVVMNDKLVIYQVGYDGYIYVKNMSNDGTWGGWGVFGAETGLEMTTNAGVSATVFNNSVVLVAKGLHGTPYSNAISYISSAAGTSGSFYPWAQIPGGSTTSRPQIAWGPTTNQFYVTAKGSAASTMWENHYDSIEASWSGWTQSAGGSTHAPSVNTYHLGNYY